MSFEQILAQYGPEAVVIAVLASVVVFLYRENKSLRTENTQIQKDRIQDTKDSSVKVTELAEKVTTANIQLNEFFRQVSDLLRSNNRGS